MEARVTFTEMRTAIEQVKSLLATFCGMDKRDILLANSINGDFGIDGDDWSLLEMQLKEKLAISLEGMDFFTYFQTEDQIYDPIDLFNWILQIFFYIILFQWTYSKWTEFYVPICNKAKLTVGDIIASKFQGKFAKRSETKFVMI